MRIEITLELDISDDGLLQYRQEWPDFATESVRETIAREMITALDSEGLLMPLSRAIIKGWKVTGKNCVKGVASGNKADF